MTSKAIICGLAVGVLMLTGCGKSSSQMEKEIADLQRQNQDLTARVEALEGKMQAVAASLPDNADDDSDSSPSN